MALFYVDCVSQQHLDETGVPMQGYITCTTIQGTAKPMYMDNSSSPVQHGAHANLDARGYVCIWVDGDTPSHFYLYDSYGRLVNSWLNITCKQGAVGPQGPQGATGATGAKGDKGDTGPQGERGLTGPAGSNGRVMTFDDLTAEQKASLKGEQGERGATGATGAQGATGQQGPQGLQGDKGDTGPMGRGLEIDWPCSTKSELENVTHPQVGDVASVATDTIGTQTVHGTLYVWTIVNGTGSWEYHGTLGNTSSSVTGISFNASTITITQSGNNPDVTANVPTFNQNTTGTAAKATNAYNDEDGVSIKTYYAKKTDIPEGVELTSNKITAVVSTSTNAEYPSGKAVWDICDTKADDSAVVHKSGNETIGGTKSFSNQILGKFKGFLEANAVDTEGHQHGIYVGGESLCSVKDDAYERNLANVITGNWNGNANTASKLNTSAQTAGNKKIVANDENGNSFVNDEICTCHDASNGSILMLGKQSSTETASNENQGSIRLGNKNGNITIISPSTDLTGNITTTLPATGGTLALDSDVVHKSGSETITGGKTFAAATVFNQLIYCKLGEGIMIENGTGKGTCRITSNTSTTEANQYQVKVPAKAGTLAVDSDVVHKSGDETINGEKTFTDQLNISKIWNNGTATFSGVIQLSNEFGAMIWNGASGKQGARLMKPANPPAQTESQDWYAVRMPNHGGTLATTDDHDSTKQDTLTAGSNITISGSTISATDTTYAVTSDADLDSIVSSLT